MAGLLFAASSGRCSARAMDLETAGAAYMENVTNALDRAVRASHAMSSMPSPPGCFSE